MIKASVAYAMKNIGNSLGDYNADRYRYNICFNSRIYELRVAKPAQAD